jgi:hypothetical protein
MGPSGPPPGGPTGPSGPTGRPPSSPTPNYLATAEPPKRSHRGRTIAIVIVALVLIGGAGAGAYEISQRNNPAPPYYPPGSYASSTAAPSSPGSDVTDSSTDSPTTTTTKPPTTTTPPSTKATVVNPQITNVVTNSPTSSTIQWQDQGDPTAAHILIAYTTGTKQQYPISDPSQEIQYPANSPYCFEIAAIGSTIRRSDAVCVNGGDASKLVKHDDGPFATTTTTV